MEDLINVSVNRKEMPFHWHKWTEINFIIRGSADGIMNNRTIKMTEGDIWVVNYEVIHSIENCSDDLLYVQMHLNIESFSRYVPNINTVYFQCYPGECEPAAEELLESDMTITDISYECGFSAPRYYNAAFKKYFSCTPLEYRRKIKNDIRAAEEVSADTLVFRDGTEISEIMPFIRKYSGDTYSIRRIRLKGSLRISSNRLEKHTWRSLMKRRNAYR